MNSNDHIITEIYRQDSNIYKPIEEHYGDIAQRVLELPSSDDDIDTYSDAFKRFRSDIIEWRDALFERRLFVTIPFISRNGMRRGMRFYITHGDTGWGYNVTNSPIRFLQAMGIPYSEKRRMFLVDGAGMNMINYVTRQVANRLKLIGVLTPVEYTELTDAQNATYLE